MLVVVVLPVLSLASTAFPPCSRIYGHAGFSTHGPVLGPRSTCPSELRLGGARREGSAVRSGSGNGMLAL